MHNEQHRHEYELEQLRGSMAGVQARWARQGSVFNHSVTFLAAVIIAGATVGTSATGGTGATVGNRVVLQDWMYWAVLAVMGSLAFNFLDDDFACWATDLDLLKKFKVSVHSPGIRRLCHRWHVWFPTYFGIVAYGRTILFYVPVLMWWKVHGFKFPAGLSSKITSWHMLDYSSEFISVVYVLLLAGFTLKCMLQEVRWIKELDQPWVSWHKSDESLLTPSGQPIVWSREARSVLGGCHGCVVVVVGGIEQRNEVERVREDTGHDRGLPCA